MVRLDRNQKQSRAEEKLLERNTMYLGGNVQLKEGYEEELYRGSKRQIT